MDYSNNSNIKRQKRLNSKTRKLSNKLVLISVRLLIASILVGGFAAVGTVIGAVMGVIEATPQFDQFNLLPDSYATIVYLEQDGSIIDRFTGDENREYVKLKDMPQYLKDAFVAIEDERFYSHSGIDIRSLGRATLSTISGNGTQGASTITQQLIKNNVSKLTRNSVQSKIQEIYLALEYEKNFEEQLGSKEAAKDYILELYMNTIALHHNLNGVKTAAQYYFGKDVADLTLAESAAIAGITQNPSRYAPDTQPEGNLYKRTLVLNKMLELNFISQSEYNEAIAEDISVQIAATSQKMAMEPSYHSYYMDQVIRDVTRDLEAQYGLPNASEYVYNSGLQIYVPMDPYIQDVVDEAFLDDSLFPSADFEIDIAYGIYIKNSITGETRYEEYTTTVKTAEAVDEYMAIIDSQQIGENEIKSNYILHTTPQPQAAMVIIDYHTGYVKAIAGSRGEKQTDMAFNRATQAYRSPGSVFKVLASYLPALDMGLITPQTLIEDAPYTVNEKSINNWNGRYLGYTSVRTGIVQSMNVLAVKNMVETTGIQNAFDYLLNLGFTTLVDSSSVNNDLVPSLALGGLTKGVYQHELAAAYGAIANNGQLNSPKFYTKVLDRDGNVLLENKVEPVQVMKPSTAYMLTDMMEGVLTSGTGTTARLRAINMPAAGKTGTTTETKDLTFVGYTPYYVASIWTGFDQQKVITGSSNYHLVLWRTIMEEIHKDLPYKDFSQPEEIVYTEYCMDSGLLPNTQCYTDIRGSRVTTELFNDGNRAPTTYCNLHVSLSYDIETGMKAGPNCPAENVQSLVGVLGTPTGINLADEAHIVNTLIYNGGICTVHNVIESGTVPTYPTINGADSSGTLNEEGFYEGDDIIDTSQDGNNDNIIVVPGINTGDTDNSLDNSNSDSGNSDNTPEYDPNEVTPPTFTATPSPSPTPTPVPTYNPDGDFNESDYIENFYNDYEWQTPSNDDTIGSENDGTSSYIDDFYNNYNWETPQPTTPSIDDFDY